MGFRRRAGGLGRRARPPPPTHGRLAPRPRPVPRPVRRVRAAWARIALIDVNLDRPKKRRSSDSAVTGTSGGDGVGDASCCGPPDACDAALLPPPPPPAASKAPVLMGWQAALATWLFAWELLRTSPFALRRVVERGGGGGGGADGTARSHDSSAPPPPAARGLPAPCAARGLPAAGASQPALTSPLGGAPTDYTHRVCVCRTVDVVLFALGHALALLNMLVAMTYNPGLLVALVAGACVRECVRACMCARQPTGRRGGLARACMFTAVSSSGAG